MRKRILFLLFLSHFLVACSDDSMPSFDRGLIDSGHDQFVIGDLLARDGSNDIESDLLKTISFPADEARHNNTIEWWYYTGKLKTNTGIVYGFEFTIFQVLYAGQRFYIGHHAISDLEENTFTITAIDSFEEQLQPTAGFSFSSGDWVLKSGGGSDELNATTGKYNIDLKMEATTDPVLQYGTGVMSIGSKDPFYYYSYPLMTAIGTLRIDDNEVDVSGDAWMDHQWGNMGPDYSHWEWFSLRMSDGTRIMLFDVYNKSKELEFRGGSFIEKDGTLTPLSRDDFSIQALDTWKSPHSDHEYSQNWQIAIPSKNISVEVRAKIIDQEFYESWYNITPIYWEGICDVIGTRSKSSYEGYAYVEITAPHNM